jgi:hypothetical protein
MTKRDELVRVFTCTELTCNLLKAELEKAGIPVMIRNEFQSAVAAGFGIGAPSAIDIYVAESNVEAAIPVIEGFLKDNPSCAS